MRAGTTTAAWARLAAAGLLVTLTLTLWSGCSRPSDPVAAGLTRQVGPVPRPCHGVRVTPGRDIQTAIDRHPARVTFCLSAGVHRIARPLRPRAGDRLIGQDGAVVTGAKVLTGWRRSGKARWTTSAFLPPRPGTHGVCRPGRRACAHAQDVFLDTRRLGRAGAVSSVTPGTAYADYRTNTITIGQDPRSHLVEQAVAPSLVEGTADRVTVANLVLEGAANRAQVAAVESRRSWPAHAGSGWRIVHNEVRLNHGVGIGVAGGATVLANDVHDQGQLGVGVWGTGAVLDDNEIADNGSAGYSPDWEAGGVKSWATTRETLTHNFVHDNAGPGLWADGGCAHTVYRHNEITDNWGAGIQHEISYDATITENRISGNGRRRKGWAWDAGIQIQSSGGNRLIEIARNVVTDNANGITLIDSGRRRTEQPAPHGRHLVRNVWVHDNVVTMSADQLTGAVEDTGDLGIFRSGHNRFDSNTYILDSLTRRHFAWGDARLPWPRWRGSGSGNDSHGNALLAASGEGS